MEVKQAFTEAEKRMTKAKPSRLTQRRLFIIKKLLFVCKYFFGFFQADCRHSK
jgi:hypothetical protein